VHLKLCSDLIFVAIFLLLFRLHFKKHKSFGKATSIDRHFSSPSYTIWLMCLIFASRNLILKNFATQTT
jgi:uncharacterized membrane protein